MAEITVCEGNVMHVSRGKGDQMTSQISLLSSLVVTSNFVAIKLITLLHFLSNGISFLSL